MATCKDCIHKKVCVILAFPEAFENTEWEKEHCDHFKNKADFVEVVRCGKCGARNTTMCCCAHWEDDYETLFDENGFCSGGERREDND